MVSWEYDDEILYLGNGAGFLSIECGTGIYRAFEECGKVPGTALTSSGSTLFTSLFYSVESTKWFDAVMDFNDPSAFIELKPIQAVKTAFSKSNYIFDNQPVYDILNKNMTGNATRRVTTSVTRNDDWTSHMKKVTPGWATAATSIPFIFKPVKIGDHVYSDGGVLNNLPAPSIEESKKYKRIFVFIAPPTKLEHSDSLIPELLNLLQALMERECHQLKELGFFDLPNVTVIQPPDALGGGLLNWSPNFALREAVYEQTKELLKDVKLD